MVSLACWSQMARPTLPAIVEFEMEMVPPSMIMPLALFPVIVEFAMFSVPLPSMPAGGLRSRIHSR